MFINFRRFISPGLFTTAVLALLAGSARAQLWDEYTSKGTLALEQGCYEDAEKAYRKALDQIKNAVSEDPAGHPHLITSRSFTGFAASS
jgi:tetratricopeptide (TPR) repeat protein